MPKRYVNKKHLEWVSSLECCIGYHFGRLEMLGIAPDNYSRCSDYNIVQSHHLLKPYFSERGMGLKAGDKDVIPLCEKHHRELHKRGNEYSFFTEVVLNSRFGIMTVQKIWDMSPHNKERKNDKDYDTKRKSFSTFNRKQKD